MRMRINAMRHAAIPRRGVARLLALGAALALAGCASDLPETPPPADAVPPPSLFNLSPGTPVDGTLRITVVRGQASARGTLETNGQRFRVTATGLSAQGAPSARSEAEGQVYGLERSGDFAGSYRVVGDAEAAAADFAGGLRLGNQNLVLIRLRPRQEGTVLVAAPAGVTITMGR